MSFTTSLLVLDSALSFEEIEPNAKRQKIDTVPPDPIIYSFEKLMSLSGLFKEKVKIMHELYSEICTARKRSGLLSIGLTYWGKLLSSKITFDETGNCKLHHDLFSDVCSKSNHMIRKMVPKEYIAPEANERKTKLTHFFDSYVFGRLIGDLFKKEERTSELTRLIQNLTSEDLKTRCALKEVAVCIKNIFISTCGIAINNDVLLDENELYPAMHFKDICESHDVELKLKFIKKTFNEICVAYEKRAREKGEKRGIGVAKWGELLELEKLPSHYYPNDPTDKIFIKPADLIFDTYAFGMMMKELFKVGNSPEKVLIFIEKLISNLPNKLRLTQCEEELNAVIEDYKLKSTAQSEDWLNSLIDVPL